MHAGTLKAIVTTVARLCVIRFQIVFPPRAFSLVSLIARLPPLQFAV